MNRHAVVSVLAAAMLLATSTIARAQSVNTLSDAEKKQGWTLLFNGKTLMAGVSAMARRCRRTGSSKTKP